MRCLRCAFLNLKGKCHQRKGQRQRQTHNNQQQMQMQQQMQIQEQKQNQIQKQNHIQELEQIQNYDHHPNDNHYGVCNPCKDIGSPCIKRSKQFRPSLESALLQRLAMKKFLKSININSSNINFHANVNNNKNKKTKRKIGEHRANVIGLLKPLILELLLHRFKYLLHQCNHYKNIPDSVTDTILAEVRLYMILKYCVQFINNDAFII
jgi:hypothetical protein